MNEIRNNIISCSYVYRTVIEEDNDMCASTAMAIGKIWVVTAKL
jgi:hypothetical protein